MGIRILFVPFEKPSKVTALRPPGGVYQDKNARWMKQYAWNKRLALVEGREAHDAFEHWYDGKVNSMIRGLGKDDQLYIRGHSSPGIDGVYDIDVDREESDSTTFNSHRDLVLKLQEASISSSGRKNIVVLTAAQVVARLITSGLPGDFAGKVKCYNCHSAADEESFAYCMRDALRDKAFKTCKIFGYRGALSSFHDGDGVKTSSASPGTTAKAARVEIPDVK